MSIIDNKRNSIDKARSVLAMFVHNNQSTAAVSVADIASRGGSADMNISLKFYFDSGTFVCEEVVESLIAIFQREKST